MNPLMVIFTINPSNVKHYLQENFDNYRRDTNTPRFDRLLGGGIFNANGESWREQRYPQRQQSFFFHLTTILSNQKFKASRQANVCQDEPRSHVAVLH